MSHTAMRIAVAEVDHGSDTATATTSQSASRTKRAGSKPDRMGRAVIRSTPRRLGLVPQRYSAMLRSNTMIGRGFCQAAAVRNSRDHLRTDDMPRAIRRNAACHLQWEVFGKNPTARSKSESTQIL
jgi:hypothetical protein